MARSPKNESIKMVGKPDFNYCIIEKDFMNTYYYSHILGLKLCAKHYKEARYRIVKNGIWNTYILEVFILNSDSEIIYKKTIADNRSYKEIVFEEEKQAREFMREHNILESKGVVWE